MKQDIEVASKIEREKVTQELHEFAVPLFKAGAEWRINSVWHKPSDIAEPGKDCLVEHMDIDGNVCICIDWRSEYEWVKSCHYNKILRWAYIKDLLQCLMKCGH